MGFFWKKKRKQNDNEPIVIEKEEQTQAKIEEEPPVDPRIAKAIKEIEEGKELSAALRNGSSGLTMYYEIKSMKDGAVCEHCKELHGQKLLFENAVVGVNYPPFDCCTSGQCRCMALSKMK